MLQFQTQSKNTNLTSLISLMPRQVMLAKQNMKHDNNIKLSSENGSTDKKTLTLKPDQKTLLLHSILQFLQRNGFSKTLKKFRSEAKLDENDGWKGGSLDLEEMYYKCLETCSHANTNFDSYKEQDLHMDGITKKDGDGSCDASVETVSKKKKKRSDETDSNAVVNQPGPADKFNNAKNPEEILTNDLAPESNVKSKEEKKRKKSFDTIGQETEQVSSEVLKEPADDIECEPQLDESNKKCKSKKKKNVEHHQLEALPGMTEDKSKDLVSSEGKITTDSDINKKSKDKKKKKDKPTSDSKKDNFQTLEEDATRKEDKGSKKRKRLASEENDSQPIDKVAIEEYKRRKTEGLEESKASEKLTKVNTSLGSEGHAGNKSKEENGKVGFNNTQKTSIKQLDTQANGNLERNGENSAVQKTLKKQHNGSVEPKTINAFQRVKVDEVVFVDEKLQDNSYWAKGGAEIGYGAKAQEVLGQVKGRDFRHEKTKKKRGSYRGGLIDLQSHSVKFNYSDED